MILDNMKNTREDSQIIDELYQRRVNEANHRMLKVLGVPKGENVTLRPLVNDTKKNID